MLWDLVQPFHVLGDQLRCAMVVVQYGQYSVDYGVVGLAEADVDAEDGVDEGEDQAVDEMPDRRAHALFVVKADVSGGVVGGWLLGGFFRGCWREVGLYHLFALADGQAAALLIGAGVEGPRLALADHVGVIEWIEACFGWVWRWV